MKIPKHVFRVPTKPSVAPNEKEVHKVLELLGMNEKNIRCAYCGGKHTEWDHLKPFVEDRKPTGYYTSIRNLVPACGKCNQSKGNENWREWMENKFLLAEGFAERFHCLEKYEEWAQMVPIPVEKILGTKVWNDYFERCNQIVTEMKTAQDEAKRLAAIIHQYLEKQNASG